MPALFLERFPSRLRVSHAFARKLVLFCAACGLLIFAKTAAPQSRRGVAVPVEIVKQMLEEGGNFEGYTVERLSKFLVVKLVDLNRDGKPEFLVRGINDICGPYWCTHRVYRKTAGGYQLLFEDAVQDLKPQKTFTNGYRDLMSFKHGSAYESELDLYKFDGKEYRLKRCFLREYMLWDKRREGFYESKRPKITRIKCDPEE
jgi:hypothetical protein